MFYSFCIIVISMHKFFRNFFYSLLSTTFFLSPSAIANIQKRILVTEFVQSNEGELAEVDGLGDKRKDIIFNECLKSSVSKKRFNKILANGGKVISYEGIWQNQVEYMFDTQNDTELFDSFWVIEKGVCKGKEYLVEVNKSVYEKILSEPEDILIRSGPYNSLFKYKNAEEIYNQKYFHFAKSNEYFRVNVLSYLESGAKYHIVLNQNNTFTMTSSINGEKAALSSVKGTWKRKANNHFHLVFDNGDYVTLERLEY